MEETEKNETLKAAEQASRDATIQDIWDTLNKNQLWLLSWVSHTSLQKGRIMGHMEMDGKTAREIGRKLQVDPKLIQKALDEDPWTILGISERSVDNGSDEHSGILRSNNETEVMEGEETV